VLSAFAIAIIPVELPFSCSIKAAAPLGASDALSLNLFHLPLRTFHARLARKFMSSGNAMVFDAFRGETRSPVWSDFQKPLRVPRASA
jgi:hypothetical protein